MAKTEDANFLVQVNAYLHYIVTRVEFHWTAKRISFDSLTDTWTATEISHNETIRLVDSSHLVAITI